jgi:glycosyltransferase involved in cell wall biosynthesis
MPTRTVSPPRGGMRIVIPTGIFPPDIGGPASYVPRIARALGERGHAVEVVTLADDPAAGGDFPFPVRRIRRGKARLTRMIETVSAIGGAARSADLIFANGLFIEAAVAAALSGKPLAMKIVGDWAWERARNAGAGSPALEEFQSRRQPLRWEAVKFLRSAVTRRAGMIIAPSRYLAGVIAAWGIPDRRIHTVHNAVENLPDAAPAVLPPFSGTTLITVARLVPWKGIDALIELIARRTDLRLFVVGDGPERPHLESLARSLGVADRAVFTGTQPRQKVAELLRAADLFVLNSAYEGLPHIILEAFSEGLPVIATDCGGTPEVVEDGINGLLIPLSEPNELEAAVDRLLSDGSLRGALAEEGRRTVEDRFSWPALVDRAENLLRLAAEGKAG